MEPLRLDPADPLASVLRWLAALAHALGLERGARPRLDRAGAADVRRWLARCTLELRALIRADAARLARRLLKRRIVAPRKEDADRHPPLSPRGRGVGARGGGDSRPPKTRRLPAARARLTPGPSPTRGEGKETSPSLRAFAGIGRFVAVASSARARVAPPTPAARAIRPAWDALLDPDAEAALRRRTRAVLFALKDRRAATRRLALRLARRMADAAPKPARFPRPPRALTVAPRALAPAPEPRPPDAPASARRPASRPAAPAAAAPALGRSPRRSAL